MFATEKETSGGSMLTEVNELAARPMWLSSTTRGHRDDAAREDPERLAESLRIEVLVGGEGSRMVTSGLLSG